MRSFRRGPRRVYTCPVSMTVRAKHVERAEHVGGYTKTKTTKLFQYEQQTRPTVPLAIADVARACRSHAQVCASQRQRRARHLRRAGRDAAACHSARMRHSEGTRAPAALPRSAAPQPRPFRARVRAAASRAHGDTSDIGTGRFGEWSIEKN